MRNSSTPTTSEAGTEASPQGEASHRKQWTGAQQAQVGRAGTAAARVRRLRALAVLAATGATLAVWAVARLLGVDVTVQLGGPGTAQPVDPAVVVIVSVLAGLAGWGVLAGLERLTARAGVVWAPVAIVVLAVSLVGPLASGTTAGARVSLAAMHVVAAAILIPVYVRTSPR